MMRGNMQKRSATYFIMGILIVLFLSSLYFIYATYRIDKESVIQNNIENLRNKILITENIYYELAHLVFETLFIDSDFEALMHEASHAKTEEEKKEIRYRLYEMSVIEYSVLLKYNFRQFHYHLPTTESFLRMHKPDKYGDLLGDIRPTVLETNRQQKEQRGFEEGRIYNGYRYVFPLSYKQEHVGSVEFSTSALAILQHLKKLYGMDYHFIISKDVVDSTVFEEQREEYYAPCSMNPDFYIDLKATDMEFIERISSEMDGDIMLKKCKKQFDAFEPFCCCVKTSSNKYYVTGIPIENYSGNKVGYILQFADNINSFDIIWESFITRLIIVIVIFTLLIFFTFIYSKYLINKESLNRLETISAMSVTASHEMNQPLQIMLMHVEMLETSDECGEECMKRIGKIHDCINRIEGILSKMNNLKSIALDDYTESEKMLDLEKSSKIYEDDD